MNIAVYIASQMKGVLISIGKKLAEEHNIYFIARDKYVVALIKQLFPEASGNTIDLSRIHPFFDGEDIIGKSLNREKKYGHFFSMLTSFHRSLGKGYIFNADKHPDIISSWWPHEKKMTKVLSDCMKWESLFQKNKFDILLTLVQDHTVKLIADHYSVKYFSMNAIKLGSRFFWADNPYFTSSNFIHSIHKNIKEFDRKSISNWTAYEQESGSKYYHSLIRFTYFNAFRLALHQIIKQTYQKLKGTFAKDSYRYLGWLPPIFRRPYMYNYFLKCGKSPEDLKDYRIVYFPLHLEPEIALMSLSPEFNNSMEMIAWISKSLPADTLLVIKEQPFAFGIRSKHYYDNLRRITNVVLASPKITSWEWIKASNIVASITGTVATEGVLFKKPVISYGKHQIVNHLPTVRYASNYDTTRKYIKELLCLSPDDERFEVARYALYKAQMESSFDMPGIEKLYSDSSLHMDLAQIAVDNLYKQYPDVFSQ